MMCHPHFTLTFASKTNKESYFEVFHARLSVLAKNLGKILWDFIQILIGTGCKASWQWLKLDFMALWQSSNQQHRDWLILTIDIGHLKSPQTPIQILHSHKYTPPAPIHFSAFKVCWESCALRAVIEVMVVFVARSIRIKVNLKLNYFFDKLL